MQEEIFFRLINDARKLNVQAQEAEVKLIDYIARNYPDINFQDVDTQAPSADNLQEAVTCYLQYGEYSPEAILTEIKQLT